jgi:hypothetical protein
MAKEYDTHEDAQSKVASSMGTMERLVEGRNNEALTKLAHESNNCEGQPGYEGVEHAKA